MSSSLQVVQYKTEAERFSLMRELGVEYLTKSRICIKEFPKKSIKYHKYYRENRKEFEQLHSDYANQIKKGHKADISIGYIGEEVGYGLFANSDIKKGDLIGEYTGEIRRASSTLWFKKKKVSGYPTDYAWTLPVSHYKYELEVNARFSGNELRFANHSFDPNLYVEHLLLDNMWVIFFIADKDINSGEQLTVDYGEEYWSGGFRELVLF